MRVYVVDGRQRLRNITFDGISLLEAGNTNKSICLCLIMQVWVVTKLDFQFREKKLSIYDGSQSCFVVKVFGYIVMSRARMFRSLIPVLMIKERNIRARNITI